MCLATSYLAFDPAAVAVPEPTTGSHYYMKLPRYHQAHVDGSGVVRRSHSANSSRQVPSRRRNHHHHQSAVPTRSQSSSPTITQGMPIPPSSGSGHAKEFRQNVGRSDLTRMYDHATWSMYERIVSARRRRMTQLDASGGGRQRNNVAATTATSAAQSSSAAPSSSGRSTPSNGASGNRETCSSKARPSSRPQPLSNVRSFETPTASTADESSSSTSSWSRTTSPVPAVFLRCASAAVDGRGVEKPDGRSSSEPLPPRDDFIFEMDM